MENVVPVSIVVRSMDRPTLKRALDSISAQTAKPAEVIVVAACGDSHGALPKVHDDIRAKLVFGSPPERLIRPRAGNAGLRAATQEWIGFLDDDDELMPHHLATLYPAASGVFGQDAVRGRLAYSLAQGVDEAGHPTDVYGRSFTFVQIWENTILHTMSALFHRSLLNDGCAFDENLEIHEDWDFWIQCSQHTAFTFVENITCIWHGSEGDSGCGFGKNVQDSRYRNIQAVVKDKWRTARDAILGRIREMEAGAIDAQRSGQDMQAIQLSQQVLLLDPENANMASLLGTYALLRGQLDQAQVLFESAIRHAPPHHGLFYNMGLLQTARGDNTSAQGWFERALALNPHDPRAAQRLRSIQ
jgi:hypothetical protein